ncbi:MAG: nucleoside monophosphate kinase [Patescibacteria group bacterium]|nr:nucleoside monophosphate kinase [Patescibacteria group bacterium]MCL5093628.1 nucleoside monophosphate kinase [Patescibacteria group bacterium]
MAKVENFIFIGAPGSGKDTQIEGLCAKKNFKVVSTGDIARKKGETDPKISEILKRGGFISDDLVEEWIKEAISKINPGKSLIIDGFPRSISQAKKLEEILIKNNREITKAIFLEVPNEKLVSRLSKRYSCKVGDRILSLTEEECIKLGGISEKREDDNLEAIQTRIKLFHKKTEPLLAYFEKEGKLLKVNGDQTIEQVENELLSKLNLV